MKSIVIPVLRSAENGVSEFIEESYSLDDFNGLFISSRIEAQNFRHRMSQFGYFSSWHVAVDPTLIIIRQGTLRIGLRDGDFHAGDLFIAKDSLRQGEDFDEHKHGHTAKLIGEQELFSVHIKLSQN